jgi:AraC-like DNA-binding protein
VAGAKPAKANRQGCHWPGATAREESYQELRLRFASSRVWVVEHRCLPGHEDSRDSFSMELPALGFVLCGLGVIESGRRTLHADPNQVVLFAAGNAYRARHVACQGGACALTIRLSQEVFDGAVAESGRRPRADLPPLLARPPQVTLALHRLLEAIASPFPDALAVDEALGWVLHWSLATIGERNSRGGARLRQRRVDRVKELLADGFRRPPSLSRLAREVGCSPFHLCRIFKRETGIGISQYVHRLRVNEALARLRQGAPSLTDLALDLGFASHSHFTAVFRRTLGHCPSQVRGRGER